ncbi:MAG TPA: PD-(D/E)XK nuclease family protein [Candidatus Brocadiia bacterium]|nr:PD-(D/E)XK nuclease family protein [Candidatus Brocadiia bacterium]
MNEGQMNTFIAGLRRICAERLLDEKRLIAPNIRVGYQWTRSVVRGGQAVVNCRVMTMTSLAMELAADEIQTRGLRIPGRRMMEALCDSVFSRLQARGGGYLSRLQSSQGLTETIARTVRDMRLAGLTPPDLDKPAFERPDKAGEIRELLEAYCDELGRRGFADHADALRMAAEAVKRRYGRDGDGSGDECPLFIMPQDMLERLGRLESDLWRAIPEERKVLVPVDAAGTLPEGDCPDIALLRMMKTPSEAPQPRRDGTVRFRRMIGEVNEVRDVIRTCISESIPYDEVEVIHTDSETYIPMLFEEACRYHADPPGQPPVTFAEGIPIGYSRPGRAFRAWTDWIRGNFPQATLVRMVQDGLLLIPEADEGDPARGLDCSRLGTILRAVKIGFGADRYLMMIDKELNAVELELRDGERVDPEERDEKREDKRRKLELKSGALKRLRTLCEGLIAVIPKDNGQIAALESARDFLENRCSKASMLDNYARKRLLDEIRELSDCVRERGEIAGLDIWAWLSSLSSELTICGQGPRPGCIYVSDIETGGHSGRKHTFIIGMDDTRFPGGGRQDPLLLDNERKELSDGLATSEAGVARRVEGFHNLLARLCGAVTMSYCSRSLADDRDMFPSSEFMSAFRAATGIHDADQNSIAQALSPPVSFAPETEGGCAAADEWWLVRLRGGKTVADAESLIADIYPNLGRGFKARDARDSDRFTEYDGHVPEAGRDRNPSKPDGHLLSSSQLEMLGHCPMEFFLKHILGVEPPEELEVDPAVWLDPRQKGSFIHDLFCEFMRGLVSEGLKPELERDRERLRGMLDRKIDEYRELAPPPSEEVFRIECNELRNMADTFLRSEEEMPGIPRWFEVCIGMKPDGEPSELERAEPVWMELPDRTRIRIRGIVDRIDEVAGSKGKRFNIWDYKTGSAWKYNQNPPFDHGRVVQNALYVRLVGHVLKEKRGPEAKVEQFGYFFPGSRERGLRLTCSATGLEAGYDVIARLSRMIREGCFPFTTKAEKDMRFSDYGDVFDDPIIEEARIRAKLANNENKALSAYRELRADE